MEGLFVFVPPIGNSRDDMIGSAAKKSGLMLASATTAALIVAMHFHLSLDGTEFMGGTVTAGLLRCLEFGMQPWSVPYCSRFGFHESQLL